MKAPIIARLFTSSPKYVLTLCLTILFGIVKAQIHDEPIDSLVRGKFTFNGYVDAYYFGNLNNPKSGLNIGKSGFARAFDQKESQFQLGLIQTKIGYKQRKSEMVADLVFGPNADLGNYGNVVGPLGDGKSSSSLAIKQAYFTYLASSKWSVTAGQFGTHIGYEVIDAPVNYNYSLSNLFNNGPLISDNNKYSTFISEIALTPKDGVNILLNYIGGNEANLDSVAYVKQMFDLTAGFQFNKKFFMGINAVQGFATQSIVTKYWGGAALYSNYAFTENYGLGIRAEYFDNTQGVQYIGKTDVTSLTLTGKISLSDGHLLLKPEVRIDIYNKRAYSGDASSDIQQFEDSNGNYTKNSQTTVSMAAIYKF
jgi:hypothetical protein